MQIPRLYRGHANKTMFKEIIHFIKYNNFMVLILVLIFVIGSGAFAATEAGQAVIGQKETNMEGLDNTLLIEAELETLDMDFKIERVEEDNSYYYVTYTYLDLARNENAWEYQLQERTRKISKKLKKDLGAYLAEELGEQYEARIKELKAEQEKAKAGEGATTQVEVTAYSGLIGQTLDVAGRIFPTYEPVKVRTIPSPTIPPTVLASRQEATNMGVADDLTDVYNNYIAEYDPDGDDVFGVLDNCPNDPNPEQLDKDDDGLGDACDEAFTLKLVEEDTPTAPSEEGTSTEDVVDEPVATSTTEEETSEDEPPLAEATEGEPEVEIIELPVEEETTGTST